MVNGKPFPIWPVWVFALVIILAFASFASEGGETIAAGAFTGAIVMSIMIHKKNVDRFGKGYKKKKK